VSRYANAIASESEESNDSAESYEKCPFSSVIQNVVILLLSFVSSSANENPDVHGSC
jgi:hypothetical protein